MTGAVVVIPGPPVAQWVDSYCKTCGGIRACESGTGSWRCSACGNMPHETPQGAVAGRVSWPWEGAEPDAEELFRAEMRHLERHYRMQARRRRKGLIHHAEL